MAATSYQDPGFAPASMPPSPPRLQAALVGGLFIGVLSALPFVNLLNCCCLWVITGGMLAAYIVQQNHPLPISIGDGLIVGFGAGLFGGIVSFLLSIPLNIYLGPVMAGVYQGFVRNGGRQDMPAEARHFLAQIGPRGAVIVGGLVFGMMSIVFGTIGGMLGALFFRAPAPPPVPVAPPVPPPAPPPPPALPPDDVSII